jgi:hypothetical protein
MLRPSPLARPGRLAFARRLTHRHHPAKKRSSKSFGRSVGEHTRSRGQCMTCVQHASRGCQLAAPAAPALLPAEGRTARHGTAPTRMHPYMHVHPARTCSVLVRFGQVAERKAQHQHVCGGGGQGNALDDERAPAVGQALLCAQLRAPQQPGRGQRVGGRAGGGGEAAGVGLVIVGGLTAGASGLAAACTAAQRLRSCRVWKHRLRPLRSGAAAARLPRSLLLRWGCGVHASSSGGAWESPGAQCCCSGIQHELQQ